MIPYVITERQRRIAEYYWDESWMHMSVAQIIEALDWWNSLDLAERLLTRI